MIELVKYMKKVVGDNFDLDIKYKLFRNVYEIIHPSISKKNISNYKIVIDEDLFPLLVFYPKKVTNLDSVVIYLCGIGDICGCRDKYSNICREISEKCDKLVIAIDYFEDELKFPNTLDKCYKTIAALIKELNEINIISNNITLMGDSFGANIISAINIKSKDNNNKFVSKEVLFYPVVSGEYFGESKFESIIRNSEFDLLTINRLSIFMKKYINKKSDLKNKLVVPLKNMDYDNFPDTLVVVGNMDPLYDEGVEYFNRISSNNKKNRFLNVEFAGHGFLGSKDDEIKLKVFKEVKKFIK